MDAQLVRSPRLRIQRNHRPTLCVFFALLALRGSFALLALRGSFALLALCGSFALLALCSFPA